MIFFIANFVFSDKIFLDFEILGFGKCFIDPNIGDDQADPESDFPNFRLLFAIFWKIYRESTGKPCAHRERARRELSKTFEILKIGPVALEKSSFKHRNKIRKC